MDKLPELPFEVLLRHLSLTDRLRLSAVCRNCHQKVANSRVKILGYSGLPIGHIRGKSRWVSGPFAENFISSIKFGSFFRAFGPSILSTLTRLRLCEFELKPTDQARFVRSLNSFGQLEELDIVRVQCCFKREFELNLPMLTSLHLEQLTMNQNLILKASRLRKVRVLYCADLGLGIVHYESVESFVNIGNRYVTVRHLKNLKYLHQGAHSKFDPALLSSLKQLKEIHTDDRHCIFELFKQKQKYDLTDLKIYLYGLRLNDANDAQRVAMRNSPPGYLDPNSFRFLANHPSGLADEIPFYRSLPYTVYNPPFSGFEIEFMKRFTYLNKLKINAPVRDARGISCFLGFLKSLEHISELWFEDVQPQAMFNRLPEHCAVQRLTIVNAPSDLGFISRLSHLTHLELHSSTDAEIARKVFEELPLLFFFAFRKANRLVYYENEIKIEIDRSKRFMVSDFWRTNIFSDLDNAIQYAVSLSKQDKPSKPIKQRKRKKRKVD